MLATPDITEDWARPLHERRIEALGELAEMGMELARGIKTEALKTDDTDRSWAFQAFSKISRAVRLSFMLQARFIEDLENRDRGLASANRKDRVQQAKTIIKRIADGAGHDEVETFSFAADAAERLDRDDIYGDILSRPVSELIAMICKDLGLKPDWPKLAQEAWMQGEEGRPRAPSPSMGEGAGMGVFARSVQEKPLKAVSTQPPAPSASKPADTPPSKPSPIEGEGLRERRFSG